MRTLKALGAMLTYPSPELVNALPEILQEIRNETALSAAAVAALTALTEDMTSLDPFEVQEQYVALFDRGRQTSLHLFEHVHSESRDRGQAMVDLLELYGKAGLVPPKNELPDYLPMVLEYLSLRPMVEVQEVLADCAHILAALGERLHKRDSRYASVFAALLEIAEEPGFHTDHSTLPEPPDKSLDEEWKDEPVVFGPHAAPCNSRQPGVSVMQFVPNKALAAQRGEKP